MPRRGQDFFEKKGEAFKGELIDAIPADENLKIYTQGEWLDLCRGPHMPSTGKIGDAFKLMKVAGAYRRGDHTRPMLSRIYATAFANKEELDAYLKRIEEAERRDHRRLGREMGLFHFQEEGPGAVFWHPKGWTLFQTLVGYMRRRQKAGGYRSQYAAGARPRAVGDVRPLADLSRTYVFHQDGGRTGFRAQADELPRPRADFKNGSRAIAICR